MQKVQGGRRRVLLAEEALLQHATVTMIWTAGKSIEQ